MSIQHLVRSPVIIIGLTASLTIATFFIARGFSARVVDPHVTIEPHRSIVVNEARGRPNGVATNWGGEVFQTADRIGEATALALATSLYAATEQLQGKTPRGVKDLVAGVSSKGLLQPGLAMTQTEGVLASATGTISIRYRPAPLAIEILSLGKSVKDGPGLIVRVPDDSSAKGEAKLYIAGNLKEVAAPPPFAPAAEIIALGWAPELLRSLKQ
jgi:hypothetical protein